MGFLRRHEEKIYAVLRILAGLMFMMHGAQKLLGMLGGGHPGAPAFIKYGAGTIELVGGGLIALGLFTAPAAFIASGEMAAAFFMGHVMRTGKFLPIQNEGELAALYSWVFLLFAARGSGTWSVDAARKKR